MQSANIILRCISFPPLSDWLNWCKWPLSHPLWANESFFILLLFFLFTATQLHIKGHLKFQSPPTPELLSEVQYRLSSGRNKFKKAFFKNPARIVLNGVGILMVWDLILYGNLTDVSAGSLKVLGWSLHREWDLFVCLFCLWVSFLG